MVLRPVLRIALVLAGVALVLAGCGGKSKDDTAPAPGTTSLTIYSSLPLAGPTRARAQSMLNAEKLALSESNGVIGPFTVKFVAMNDATGDKGRWNPGQVVTNARKALKDRSAIAYIGEGDSGASAVAIPVLNETGLLTVSPASTYSGLTEARDADKGEPEKYYPSGKRTFARVVPSDALQAVAQATLQRQEGCSRLFIVSDRDVYGRGIATAVGREVTEGGQHLAGTTSLPPNQSDFSSLAKDVAKANPDCVFAGITLNDDAPALLGAIEKAVPGATLFGPDALVDPGLAAPLPADVAAHLRLTALPRATSAAARSFTAAYTERYAAAPDPTAAYGYEAMKAILASIEAAGNKGNDRGEVVKQFFALHDRNSILGRYSIQRSGDTTLSGYTSVKVRDGRLRFGRTEGAST